MIQANQMQQFHSKEFGSIEVLIVEGKPFFPATDCAKILGYNQPEHAVKRHCIVDGCMKRTVIDRLGREQEKGFISEGNLYRLIIRSKLPAAAQFESWVFDTVLPSIRKYGTFIASDTLEEMAANPEFAAALLEQLQDERALNAKLSPKASYFDRILQCKNTVPVSLIAKDYGMSAVKFNLLLHNLGVQYKIAGTWLLYQKFAGKGYTQTRTYHFGENSAALHNCWTQRGRLFLYEFLSKYGILPLALFLDEAEDIFDIEISECEEEILNVGA